MGLKSKENGKKGEAIVRDFFRKRKYWVHVTGRSNSGSQPVDIIACRGTTPVLLVDAKYVEKGERFSFEDIQPDQITSLRYARDYAGLTKLGFVIVFGEHDNDMRFLSLDALESMKYMEYASVKRTEMLTLEDWERKIYIW